MSTACVIPSSTIVPPIDLVSRESLRVKSESSVEAIVSVPPPPMIVAAPVQPLTSKVLLPGPPVSTAWVIPESTNVPPVDTVIRELLSVKLASYVATTVSVPPPPVSVACPLHPAT